MGKYSDYNIIPIGDHCAIAMILQQLNLRHASYPFDWVTRQDHLYSTNIIDNIQLITELNLSDNVDDIVKKYIGDAFINNHKTNSITTICFPHDGDNPTENFEKYKRRFIRLKQDLNKKNIFVLLTRHHYIEKEIFEQQIIEKLLNYNNESIILFISGTNHAYFEDMKNNNVIFKYAGEYDVSKFPDADYHLFRPNIRNILSNLIL